MAANPGEPSVTPSEPSLTSSPLAPSLARVRRPGEWFVERGLFLSSAVSILVTLGIVAVLATESVAFFREVPLSRFFGDSAWTPLFANPRFGIWPLVAGTLLTSAIALGVAVPLGLLAAIYLSELATPGVRRVVKPALELLAGVPTLVFGYFALVVVTPLLQRAIPGLAGFNALGPGFVMGLMIVPYVSSLAEDALRAVPTRLRENAYALGAARATTIRRVVLPAAGSGITAAVLLAVARAVGETMIVTIAAGQQPRLTLDPRVPIETMTAYIVQISLGDTPADTLEYRTIFAVGAALFLLTFALNAVTQRFTRRLRRAA
ncbi:MAG: phosphate ABC transporter permease subunit PstC [Deltaproteobacteria bacterium]|nr:phosphate ABC transporter permease subunit PstC [Deltaproteobacteria bacterium]